MLFRSQKWSLPVCFSSNNEKLQCQVLRETEQTLRFQGCTREPVFLNRTGRGYYITEYQPAVEARISKDAMKLDPAERMAFARDEWYLVMAGKTQIGKYLQLVKTLQADRNPEFLEAELKNLQYISDYWTAPDDNKTFQNWARSVLQPISKELSQIPNPTVDQQVMRGDVLKALAVTAKDPDTMKGGAAVHRETAHQNHCPFLPFYMPLRSSHRA